MWRSGAASNRSSTARRLQPGSPAYGESIRAGRAWAATAVAIAAARGSPVTVVATPRAASMIGSVIAPARARGAWLARAASRPSTPCDGSAGRWAGRGAGELVEQAAADREHPLPVGERVVQLDQHREPLGRVHGREHVQLPQGAPCGERVGHHLRDPGGELPDVAGPARRVGDHVTLGGEIGIGVPRRRAQRPAHPARAQPQPIDPPRAGRQQRRDPGRGRRVRRARGAELQQRPHVHRPVHTVQGQERRIQVR
jgi:hypothetical protein